MAARTMMLGGMNVHVSEPAGAGPHPAVVVCFHRDGVDVFTKTVTARLAAAGYVAAAPNFYHRRPKDEDTAEAIKTLLDAELVADIDATVAALSKMPNVKRDAIGIVGHCLGGRTSFLGACKNTAFKACAVFYGGSIGIARGPGPAPLTFAKDIACPVAGFFGNDDENPSPKNVKELADALDAAGKTHSFNAYDGAGHAFLNWNNRPRYREEQAEDAWVKLLAFFASTLKRG